MRAIKTTFKGPTNYKGSRVIATDGDHRVTVNWDHALNTEANHRKAAEALCKKMGWNPAYLSCGWLKDCFVFVFTDPTAIKACEAVLDWASTPGDHGGNPYTHKFVQLAQAAVEER
jgi:hypothetical protein